MLRLLKGGLVEGAAAASSSLGRVPLSDRLFQARTFSATSSARSRPQSSKARHVTTRDRLTQLKPTRPRQSATNHESRPSSSRTGPYSSSSAPTRQRSPIRPARSQALTSKFARPTSRPTPVDKSSKRTALNTGDIKSKLKTELTFADAANNPTSSVTSFSSPPLLPGLVDSVKELIGSRSAPTPIQSLSLSSIPTGSSVLGTQTLLASETGSGKSLAYLLPVMQQLKTEELEGKNIDGVGPRAIILCPTHELCRQIATYAKALSHKEKLRVWCASNPNSASKGSLWNEEGSNKALGGRPIDLMIGTPSGILNLITRERLSLKDARGYTAEEQGKDPVLSLDRVKWMVVDEADVMLDRDFVNVTEAIMEHIQTARRSTLIGAPPKQKGLQFNLILSSATIPVSLSTYLDAKHPKMTRLVSPNIHRLPKLLKREYVQLTDGNKLSTICKKIESVWAEEASKAVVAGASTSASKSKVVIFCNEIRSADALARYLEGKNVQNLKMVGNTEERKKGSNKHLSGFLSQVAMNSSASSRVPESTSSAKGAPGPRVLITTSLLSRGLDFDPSVKHVFVVDEPLSAVDFIHRAGRTGRAGNVGTVVLFEKGTRSDRRSAGKAARSERFGKVSKRF